MVERKKVIQPSDDHVKDEEVIAAEKIDLNVSEISSRMVNGTNPFISGSSYSDLIEDNMSTCGRISRVIESIENDRMDRIAS